jgi:hypothetical protein
MKGKGKQFMLKLPVEVLQLYFISSLYHDNFQFRNEIMLIKGNKKVITNSNTVRNKTQDSDKNVETMNRQILKKAKKSYLKWLKIVDKNGLQYVREKKIDPLSFSKGIEWRNQINNPFGM